MTARPPVSVVVAAHGGDYLEEALGSALAQTFADFEVVVSDDANNSDTRRLVESLADPRLRYCPNAVALGPAGNHRSAFRAARGEFLAILNHDDRWEPAFLAALVPPLRRDPDLAVAFCDHGIIDAAGAVLEDEAASTSVRWGRDRLAAGVHRPFLDLVLAQSIPIAMGSVLRRAAIEAAEPPDEAGPAYDLWLAYALARAGAGAYYHAERLSHWRVHRASVSARAGGAWAQGCAFCWRAMAADPAFVAHRRSALRKMARAELSVALGHLRVGDQGSARRHAARACAADPTAWKAAAAWLLSLLPAPVTRRRAARVGDQ